MNRKEISSEKQQGSGRRSKQHSRQREAVSEGFTQYISHDANGI